MKLANKILEAFDPDRDEMYDDEFSVQFNDDIDQLAEEVKKFIKTKVAKMAKERGIKLGDESLRFDYDGVKEFAYGVQLALGRKLAEENEDSFVRRINTKIPSSHDPQTYE